MDLEYRRWRRRIVGRVFLFIGIPILAGAVLGEVFYHFFLH